MKTKQELKDDLERCLEANANTAIIQDRLKNLFTTHLTADDVIDVLTVFNSSNWHLGFYLKSGDQQNRSFWGFTKDSPIITYFKLLDHLIDKGASPKKITDLLNIKNNLSRNVIGHHLYDETEWQHFMALVIRLPSEYRAQLLETPDHTNRSVFGNLILKDTDWSRNYTKSILELLRQDLLSSKNPQIAEKILDILPTNTVTSAGRNLAAELTNNSKQLTETALLLLMILNIVVTNYPNLITKALEVMIQSSASKHANYETLGGNLLRFYSNKDHIPLFLTILNKIPIETHADKLFKLLAEFQTGRDHVGKPSSHAIIQFIIYKKDEHIVNILNITQKLIQKSGAGKFIDSLQNTDASLNSLAVFLTSLYDYTSKKPEFVQTECLNFCITLFNSDPNQTAPVEYIFKFLKRHQKPKEIKLSFSNKFAYELASSQNKSVLNYLDTFATEAQKHDVLTYIQSLPKEQRVQVYKDALIPGNSLNLFFRHRNTTILEKINELLVADSIDEEVRNFLAEEKKDHATINQFLIKLSTSKAHPDTILEALSFVDDIETSRRHLGFYLDDNTLNTYFNLLHHLLDKGASPSKLAGLLSFPEAKGQNTIGHWLFSNKPISNFVDLIRRLPVHHRIDLLSRTNKAGTSLLEMLDVINRSSEERSSLTSILSDDLKNRDPQIATDIMDILSIRSKQKGNILLSAAFKSEPSNTLLDILNLINLLVQISPDLTPRVLDLFLEKNPDGATVIKGLEAKKTPSSWLYSYLSILNNIQKKNHTEKIGKLLEQVFSQTASQATENYLTLIVRTQHSMAANLFFEILTNYIKKVGFSTFIKALNDPDGTELINNLQKIKNVSRDQDEKSLLKFHEALFNLSEGAISEANRETLGLLVLHYLSLVKKTYPENQRAHVILSSNEIAYYFASNFKPAFEYSQNEKFATQAQQQAVLAHIKSLSKEQRIIAYQNAKDEKHPLHDFFAYSGSTFLNEIEQLLKQDMTPAPNSFFFSDHKEIDTKHRILPIEQQSDTSEEKDEDFSPFSAKLSSKKD